MADPPTLPNSSFPTPLKAPAVEIVDLSSPSLPPLPRLGKESERVTGASKTLENNDEALDDGEEDVNKGEDSDGDEDVSEDANEWDDLTGEGEDEDMESLYGELLDAISDSDDDATSNNNEDATNNDNNFFTAPQSHLLRARLRLVGPTRFFHETVVEGGIPARKLCTAFGMRHPPFFLRGEGTPDEAFHALLGVCMTRELRKRVKLGEWNTVEDAVALLKRAGRVVVLTGAGISTSLGIPDFRSKDTGLYARLEHLGLSDPQEVFDLHVFREDPSIFYSVAKDILPSSKRYTPTHAFIRLLQDKGKLLTNFTQNIDNLEEFAGIEKEKLVQCHGSFATATCIECKYQVECGAIYNDLRAGNVARCEKCLEHIRHAAKPGFKRKRSSNGSDLKPKKTKKRKKQDFEDSTDDDDNNNNNNEDDTIPQAGVMKPDITFFGEDLPPRFHDRLVNHDRDLVDLVIVIGTSLKVAPVSEVVGVIPAHVPQIYISREACNHVEFDIDLLGDCDTVVTELCRRLGWGLEHEMVREGGIDVKAVEGYHSRFLVKPREEGVDASSRVASKDEKQEHSAAAVETRVGKLREGKGEATLEETKTELAPGVEVLPRPPPPPTNGLDKKVEERIHTLLESGKTKYSEDFADVKRSKE